MIRCESVSFGYDKTVTVLSDVSFDIAEGETVGLIGPNGAGKSTLMKLLSGLLMCREGRILIDGIQVTKDSLGEIRGRLGFVLQDPDAQMFMPTVYEDMIFGPLNYGVPRGETEKRVDSALERLGIPELKHRRNHMISGGEKRMAAIATVLAMEPEVILMDEPTSSLDPYNRRSVINSVRALPQTKLIASHDLDMILDTCDRVILLSEGKKAAEGKTGEILKDGALLREHRLELPLCMQGRIT